MKTKRIFGQPSWKLLARDVEACITVTGGHLGPVCFDRRRRRIQPYAIAPWAEEKLDASIPPILRVLRGDFFCLPFGGNETPWRGERHPVHGESANARWRLQSVGPTGRGAALHLRLKTRLRPGRIDKRLWLLDGQNVVYLQHRVQGMSGPMNYGHHATLCFPDEPGSGRISTSPFRFGQVYPEPVEQPAQRGYSCLKPGAVFGALERVPMINGEWTDLSRYPGRRGFEDIVTLVARTDVPFAWTAVTFPKQRYVWFALRDPEVLRETIFWMSNGGRHYPPWNGRHLNVMGLEDVTSYFHGGLAESVRPNPFSRRGIVTSRRLDPRRPLVVNYIMGVAVIPAGFDRVKSIAAVAGNEAVILKSGSGKRVRTPVDLAFLETGCV